MKPASSVLALFIVLGVGAGAHAQEGVAVASFGGARGSAMRQHLVTALETAPGLSLTDDTYRARAVVEGQVARTGRQWRAEVRVRDADGRVLAHETLRARQMSGLTSVVRRWARDALVPLVASLGAAPVEHDVVERAPARRRTASTAVQEPDAPAPAAARLPAPLSVRAGFALLGRSFQYNDDIFAALRGYELPVTPVLTLGLEWRPGGHVDLGVLSGLSVRAEAELAPGLETVGPNGTVYPTELWSVGAGLRYALTFGDVTLHADGGYRAVVFAIHDANELQTRPAVPSVEIHAIQAGAGVRWDVGAGLFFAGRAAYLAPLTAGEIASTDWFPRATVGGIEGDLGLGLRIDDVELRGMFAARRFFYDMGSEPGDARVAGGAVDQYLSGRLELTWSPSELAGR